MKSFRLEHVIIVILCLALGISIGFWQPWFKNTQKRTISVTGQSTVSAAPDQFVFYASYVKSGASSAQASSEVSALGNKSVTELKKIGVPEEGLKTSTQTSQGDRGIYAPVPVPNPSDISATYTLTVTVGTKELAQKVLDYIVTTPVTTSVSPSSSFSNIKRQQLESQAREKALIDAKGKADQTAKTLNVKLGSVQTVSELNQYSGPYSLEGKAVTTAIDAVTSPTLETGTEDLTFSVTVTYALR